MLANSRRKERDGEEGALLSIADLYNTVQSKKLKFKFAVIQVLALSKSISIYLLLHR